MDMKILIKIGFFLRNICQQIEDLHGEKSNSLDPLTVYRCLKLNTSEFEKLQQNKNGFMSFNSFLLTTTDRELAIERCSISQENIEILSVLFEMKIEHIDFGFTPFISLGHLNYDSNARKDILFSMNSIFRIINITKNQRNIWQVQLTGTNVHDSLLKSFIELMRKQTPRDKGWHKLPKFMILMRELTSATQVYKILLESIDVNDENEILNLYNTLGTITFKNGNYEEAYFYFQKQLQIKQKYLPPNHRDLISTYKKIGATNSKMGKFLDALSVYEKALEMEEQMLPCNDLNLAVTYDIIGALNYKLGNYMTALSFLQKALGINEKFLPSNHPDLANNYNYTAGIYKYMGDYANALSFYQKARQIYEDTLDSNHPDLAAIYDNFGEVYQDMKQFENALSFYKKRLQIQRRSLPPNHSDFVVTYTKLGKLYYTFRKYSTALLYFKVGLEIGEVSLSEDHPWMNTLRQDIALMEKEL